MVRPARSVLQMDPEAAEKGGESGFPQAPGANTFHISERGASAPLPTSPRRGEEPHSRPQQGKAEEGVVSLFEQYCP